MSSNLTWEPSNRKSGELGSGIKFILRRLYGEPVNATFDGEDVQMLNTIIASSLDESVKEDATALIDAIGKHGSIDVREEY